MTITIRINRRFILSLCAFAAAFTIITLALVTGTKPSTAASDVKTTPCPPPTEPRVVASASQMMEHGWMVWVGDTRQVYVLTMDAGSYKSGTVAVYTEDWKDGTPETDSSIQAPAGYRQPSRGLGKVWREHPEVRNSVGWAVKDAEGHEAVVVTMGNKVWFNGHDSAFTIDGNHWQEVYEWNGGSARPPINR